MTIIAAMASPSPPRFRANFVVTAVITAGVIDRHPSCQASSSRDRGTARGIDHRVSTLRGQHGRHQRHYRQQSRMQETCEGAGKPVACMLQHAAAAAATVAESLLPQTIVGTAALTDEEESMLHH